MNPYGKGGEDGLRLKMKKDSLDAKSFIQLFVENITIQQAKNQLINKRCLSFMFF